VTQKANIQRTSSVRSVARFRAELGTQLGQTLLQLGVEPREVELVQLPDITPAQIFMMNADGSNPLRLSPVSEIQYAESDPAWFAGGREIVFWSYGYGIAAVPAGGGTPRSLFQDFPAVAYGAKPVPAPRSGAILFTANRFAAEGPALWVLGGSGAPPRVVLENAVDGVWSPDERRILFGRTVAEVAPDLLTSAGIPPPSQSKRPDGQVLTFGRRVVGATGAGAVVMSGSYRKCPECGKRALTIATRCPGCYRELPPPEAPEAGPAPALRRFLSPTVAAAALATAAVWALATIAQIGHSPAGQSSSAAVGDSASHLTAVAYAAAASPSIQPSAAPAHSAQILVARTWTNVRKARSRSAELEAVLLPGDTVLADSLGAGWYRVALYGEVLGYAHRSTLTSPGTLADSSLP
jgi:hypothetical protein